MERAEEIIRYWFGDLEPSTPEKGRFGLWFGKDEKTDREIRERFLADVERAGHNELDQWMASPRTLIALVVLLDQFPRNIFRGQARAFAFDKKAREVAKTGLARGYDRELPRFARMFLYLPLMHSENLADQDQTLALYKKLIADAPENLKQELAGANNYAQRHREIIARFGRFPHRNQALGRESTPQEIEFLKEPMSSF
ncbi:MAG TPA: DUF924 family protein [bacterium]|nr:DUF924 family protein [bacterium]